MYCVHIYQSFVISLFYSTVFSLQQSPESFEQRYFNIYLSSPHGGEQSQERSSSNKGFIGKYNISAISARCGKNSFYAGFNPEHRNAVDILTEYFIDQPDMTTFFEFCSQSKSSPDVHPKVWYAAFLRAQLFRSPRILEMSRASPIELFPTAFFPGALLQNNTSGQQCLQLDERFGQDNGIENRLWYFREDVQLNAHHWVWHLLNPTRTNRTIDRRGEFFYFFHHEIVARYAAERIANNLEPEKPLNIQTDSVLEEGFKPHLTDGISSRAFAERQPNRNLTEALTPRLREALRNLTIERNRVLETINQGGILHASKAFLIFPIPSQITDNGFFEISGHDSINILADISEASIRSINRRHYGTSGYHNQGHNIISMIDAPNGTIGVIGDEATAMRDVMFYRWHKYVDIIFQSYKLKHLKPYTPQGGDFPLLFQGIQLEGIEVVPHGVFGAPLNHLLTFWKIRQFQLDGGLDFNRTVNPNRSLTINVCAKHLDHEEFDFRMNIRNYLQKPIPATVRIFLAPRFKTSKRNQRFTMAEQRRFFFTLDAFQVVLNPGRNTLKRRSTDSSLTSDWPKSIRQLTDEIRLAGNSSNPRSACDCGFPHHLLLPKGTEEGMIFDLFAMVTDGVQDHVDNSNSTSSNEEQDFGMNLNRTCTRSYIHCGIPGRKYPDARPMGYPFDRKPYSKPRFVQNTSRIPTVVHRVVENLEQFVSGIPNMYTTQIIIQHRNEIREL